MKKIKINSETGIKIGKILETALEEHLNSKGLTKKDEIHRQK